MNGTKIISISPNDANGIKQVEILINGKILATLSSEPYQYTWNTANEVDGEHNLTVSVTDWAGNVYQKNYPITISNEEETETGLAPEEIALIVLGISFAALVATIVIVIYRRRKK
jgi:hypothetical protein